MTWAARGLRWSLALALAAGSPLAAVAGSHAVALVVEPDYTFCISASPSCGSALQTTLALEYKPIVRPKLDLRVKLARSYERSSDETAAGDIAVIPNQRLETASDTLGLRLRLFDGDGYERQEPRAGYTYQYAAGTQGAHHTFFASDALFFGARIRRGTESPAHRFRTELKISKDASATAGTLPQTFVQAAAYATFPLDPSGDWRTEAGYTVQQQLVQSDGLSPYSTRFSASLTHDFNAVARAYLRFSSRVSTGSGAPANPRSTSLLLGAKFMF